MVSGAGVDDAVWTCRVPLFLVEEAVTSVLRGGRILSLWGVQYVRQLVWDSAREFMCRRGRLDSAGGGEQHSQPHRVNLFDPDLDVAPLLAFSRVWRQV